MHHAQGCARPKEHVLLLLIGTNAHLKHFAKQNHIQVRNSGEMPHVYFYGKKSLVCYMFRSTQNMCSIFSSTN